MSILIFFKIKTTFSNRRLVVAILSANSSNSLMLCFDKPDYWIYQQKNSSVLKIVENFGHHLLTNLMASSLGLEPDPEPVIN